MAQKFDARQTISRDVLSQLLGINGTELDDLLRAINKEFNAPLRISASSPADSKINFQPAEVEAADLAAKNITPISSQIPSFVASTIDFQTGATTGGTINITFPNSTVGFFRRVGFSLDASGTIQAIFSAEAASLGALANAGTVFVKGALPIGWIDLEATAASPGRFKTAGSTTNIIEHKVGSSNRVHRIMGGGGTSTGSGSGTGDDINALTFKASFTDLFSDLPTDSVSAVDYTSGKTDSTTYDIVNTYHRLAYDATRTVTGTGVNMTLNLAPSFTIKAGDMLIVGSEARRIASLTSQTVFALESAFTTNPSASACTLSQAVHSKDLNNFAGDGIAASTAFSTTINQILMTYEDTTAANDVIFDANSVAVIGFTASSDGTNFTNVQTRPQNLSDSQSIVNLPTSGTNLYLRLFANKSSGAGSVNILGYKVFFHRDISYSDGSVLNQAYGRTDNVGTKVNVSGISVVGGKTRIRTSFSFPVGVNPGTPNGALKVYLDGQKIPRFVDGTVSITAGYLEIDQNTIELDTDYSALALEFEIVQDVAVVDASDTNTTNVSQLQETMSEGTQGFVKTSQMMNATTTVGTPAAGTFYSTITNRAAIPDLTQDLKARMGIERIMAQQIYQLQNEFGPNGESVWGVVNDTLGQIRAVGTWQNQLGINGNANFNNLSSTDYLEVTFYGTGLNIITQPYIASQTYQASVDGGTATTFNSTQPSNVLANRNYGANVVLNAVSGLSLGVHTIRLTTPTGTFAGVFGFEILTETTSLRVNPGSSYLAGKKITTLAQQSLAYNSSFESGTLGTRGGRVVVYQKSDGTIAKAVQPVNASQANLSSADHTNEEVARTYHPREFGAGRSDDFSSLTSTGSNRAFTLDDGTTTLVGSSVLMRTIVANTESIEISANSGSLTITFVGTGLDIFMADNGTGGNDSHTFSIDGGSAVAWPYTSGQSTNARWMKIVSGLPYGTHTIKFNRVSAATWVPVFFKFTVYQPKKPSIPAGAIELADYNVMADFVSAGASLAGANGPQNMSVGVLKKTGSRENTYINSWTGIGLDQGTPEGVFVHTNNVSGGIVQRPFFGTGFEWRTFFQAAAYNVTIQVLDASGSLINLASYTTALRQPGTGMTFTAGTSSTITGTSSAASYGALSVSGLPLGTYTIKITVNNATGTIYAYAFDIITPIHSPKSNIYADLQNTLPVGSNAISDNRKTTLIEDVNLQPAQVSQALGFQVATTTSTSYVPVPDLSVTHKSSTGKVQISYGLSSTGGGANAADFVLYVDGVQQLPALRGAGLSGSVGSGVSNTIIIPLSPGVHKIDLYWLATGGTMTLVGGRSLTVRDV